MNDWLAAVLLGAVEGLTEFIPVSSTGMLLLTKHFLGLPDGFWDTFDVLIQLGAILAVVVLYFGKLWRQVVSLPSHTLPPDGSYFTFMRDIASAIAGALA